MIYKNIVVLSLLLPALSYGKNMDTEKRIQELKKAKFEKQLEVSNLGKLILEKEELIESFIMKAGDFKRILISQKQEAATQNNGDNPLKNDAIEQIRADAHEPLHLFLKNITKAISQEKNIKGHLANQIFNEETGRFDMCRLAVIGVWFETELMNDYIAQYESAIQELIDIEKELDHLTTK